MANAAQEIPIVYLRLEGLSEVDFCGSCK
jgi:hypothetical protein